MANTQNVFKVAKMRMDRMGAGISALCPGGSGVVPGCLCSLCGLWVKILPNIHERCRPCPMCDMGRGTWMVKKLMTWKTKENFLPCFGSFGLESRNMNPEVFKWKQTHVSFRNRQASKLQFQVLERDDNPSLCINSRPLSQSEHTWLDQVDTWQRVL